MTRRRGGTRTAGFIAFALTFLGCNEILNNTPGKLAENGNARTDAGPSPRAEPEPGPPRRESEAIDAGDAPGADCADERRCDGVCASSDDPRYGCGDPSCAPCRSAHATTGCRGGRCVIVACDDGRADCNADADDGCESDLSSTSSCGGCNVACPPVPNGTSGCARGKCTFTCDPTHNPCGGKCTEKTDPTACGPGCIACPTPANGAARCIDDSCALACDPGFGDCDAKPENGCETSLAEDQFHCGLCGQTCLPGQECLGGVCFP